MQLASASKLWNIEADEKEGERRCRRKSIAWPVRNGL